MIDQNLMMPMTSDTDKDSGIGTRPLSELLVDLHVYRIPNDYWLPERHLAKNQAIDVSISAGFVRVLPELTLQDVRKEIAYQLGYDTLPSEFVFLRSIGRNFAKVRAKQEKQLKAKIFLPPFALEPELHLLEDPDSFLPYSSQSELEVNATVDKLSGRRRTRRFHHYHHTLQRRASSARSFERISGYDSPINSRFPPLQSSTPAPAYSIPSANNAEDLGENTAGNKNPKFPKVVKNTVRIRDDNDHGEAGDTDVTNSSRDSGLTESSQEGPKIMFPRLQTFDEFDQTRFETTNRSRLPRYKPREEMVFHAKTRYEKDSNDKSEVVISETDKLENREETEMSDSKIEYEEGKVHSNMEHEKVKKHSRDEFQEITSIQDKCIIGDGKDQNVIHGKAPEAASLTIPKVQLKSVQQESNGKEVQSTTIPIGDATNESQKKGSTGQSSVDVQRRMTSGNTTNVLEENSAPKPTNASDLNAESVQNEVEISSVKHASKTRNKSEISSKKSSIPRSIVRARGRKEKEQRPIGQPQNKSDNRARQSGHFMGSKEEIAKGEQTLGENGQEETTENKLLISEQGQLNSRDVGRGQQGADKEVAKVSSSDSNGEQDSTTHLQATQNADYPPKTPIIPKIQQKQNGEKELQKYRRVVRNPRNEPKKTSSAHQSEEKENQLVKQKKNSDLPDNDRSTAKAQARTSPNSLMVSINDPAQNPGGNAWFYDLRSGQENNEQYEKARNNGDQINRNEDKINIPLPTNEDKQDKCDNLKMLDHIRDTYTDVSSTNQCKDEDGIAKEGTQSGSDKVDIKSNLDDNDIAKDAINVNFKNIPEIKIDNQVENDIPNLREQLKFDLNSESGPSGLQSGGKDKAALRAKFLEKVKTCAKIIQELYPSELQGELLESQRKSSDTAKTSENADSENSIEINNVANGNSVEKVEDQNVNLTSDGHDTALEDDKNLINIKGSSDNSRSSESKSAQITTNAEEKVVIPPSLTIGSSTPTLQQHEDQNMPITERRELKDSEKTQNQTNSKDINSEVFLSEKENSNVAKLTTETGEKKTIKDKDNKKNKDKGTHTIANNGNKKLKTKAKNEGFENKKTEDRANQKIENLERQNIENKEDNLVEDLGNEKNEDHHSNKNENHGSQTITLSEDQMTGEDTNQTDTNRANTSIGDSSTNKAVGDLGDEMLEGHKSEETENHGVNKSEDFVIQTIEDRVDQMKEDRGCQTIKIPNDDSEIPMIRDRKRRTNEDRGSQTIENYDNQYNDDHENDRMEDRKNKKMESFKPRMSNDRKIVSERPSDMSNKHRHLKNENNRIKQGNQKESKVSSRPTHKQNRILSQNDNNFQNERSRQSKLQPLLETPKRKPRQPPADLQPLNYAKMPKYVQDRIERSTKNRRDQEQENLSTRPKHERVPHIRRRQSLSNDRKVIRNGNDPARSKSTLRSLEDKPNVYSQHARGRSEELSRNSKTHKKSNQEIRSPKKTLISSPLKQVHQQKLPEIEKSPVSKPTSNSNETINSSPETIVDSLNDGSRETLPESSQTLQPTLSPPSRCQSVGDSRSSNAEASDIRRTKSEIFELESNNRSEDPILNWLYDEKNDRTDTESHPTVEMDQPLPLSIQKQLPEETQAKETQGNAQSSTRISKLDQAEKSTPLRQRYVQQGNKQLPMKYSVLPQQGSKRSNMINLKPPNVGTRSQVQQKIQAMDQRVLNLDSAEVPEDEQQVSTNKRIKRSLIVSIDDLPSWLVSSKEIQHGSHEGKSLNRRQLLAIHRVLRTRRRKAKRIYHYYIRYLLYLRGRRQDGNGRAGGVADMWKRKYVEEARETQLLKDHCRRMAQHLEILRHQTSKQSLPATLLDPSNQTSYKMAASKLVTEIEELSRQVEITKVKLVAESKLKDQVEQEMKILRTEVVDRKIDASVTRGQFQQHQQAQYPSQWLNHTMAINSTIDTAIDEALLLN